ncbi:hypothetical protein PDM99_12250 [Bacillus cereus group sp. Bc200]|uniref:hypothetical protein n=1 Tax=Bacillus cereus group sp. Bc200 TaxID=3018112 RepID=UPI0022E46FFA|nr:hypothetical protein [Bacillus cereus group sp. Bc200]MDA2261053.1 hypothetical protein [Bacillus cereus group sp. Bc200]
MRKIDIFMKILKEQYHFYQRSAEFGENTGLNLSEIFSDFNLSRATEIISKSELHWKRCKELINLFLTDEIGEEELEYRMLGVDTTLAEEISLEQKSAVIKELSKVRVDLQLRISELDDNGVYFRDLDGEQLMVDLLKELRFSY